jgi:hypothetical protein
MIDFVGLGLAADGLGILRLVWPEFKTGFRTE